MLRTDAKETPVGGTIVPPRFGRFGTIDVLVVSGAPADRAGNGAPRHAKGFGGEFHAWMFRSIIAIFRTRVLPGDTDI